MKLSLTFIQSNKWQNSNCSNDNLIYQLIKEGNEWKGVRVKATWAVELPLRDCSPRLGVELSLMTTLVVYYSVDLSNVSDKNKALFNK